MTDEEDRAPRMRQAQTEQDALLGELAEELRAAHLPNELDPERHEALLLAALGPIAGAEHADDDGLEAPASDEESADAERLRLALEGRETHPLAHIATLMQLAQAPPPASELALRRAEHAAGLPRARTTPISWGTLGLATIAAAAAVLLWLQGGPTGALPEPNAGWLRARSAAPMFSAAALVGGDRVDGDELEKNQLDRKPADARSAEPLDYTARIDRIFAARERDLRENWYKARGLP